MTFKKTKFYFDKDAELTLIRSKNIGIIGYGNQGRAQALNLRDSGCTVKIGLRESGRSRKIAEDDHFVVGTISEVSGWADLIAVLLPDQIMADVFNSTIAAELKTGDALLFAHGYNVHYGYIAPEAGLDVIMAAPSGAGRLVREKYLEGQGVPNLIAIQQDYSQSALSLVLSYSKAIGGTRSGAFLSSFREEVETDLFGEQAVLTGGVPQLVKAAFETLVDEGFQPVVAWFVCFYELKMAVDLLCERGFSFLAENISDTAEFGGYTRGRRLIDPEMRRKMRQILREIRSGNFAAEWQAEKENGFPELKKLRLNERKDLIETMTEFMLNELSRHSDKSGTG
ncbi:MAG: ketol-acid reductoisomerase [FCB group bacterium]|nr:ketol-acid reductoisomerase [FCB group bacterium]